MSNKAKFKRYLPLYLMFLPGAIYLIINNYLPLAGLVVAFKKYSVKKGIFGSDWIGIRNFEFLFKTQDAWIITRNTILYNLVFIVLNTIFSIMVAVFVCDTLSKRAKKSYQSLILFPNLMSAVVLSYIVWAFLGTRNGMVNNFVLPLFDMAPIDWYSQPKYWPFILVLVNLWKGFGYGSLIYIASINGIDPTLYEAAALDGAGKWKQIRHITLPSILPTVITLTLMNIGRIFYSDFGLFYQVPRNSGALVDVTNTIDTYVYRGLMEQSNIGMSSASGFYQSLVGFTLVMIANAVTRKISRENALF